MLWNELPHSARIAPACALFVVMLAGGCSDGIGKTYPVRGKVTVDGEPLAAKNAVVMFVPDRARGNTSPYEPGGTIDSDGNYVLYTKSQRGAPAGWYKVVVTAFGESTPLPAKGPLTHRPTAKSLVPAPYGQASTTPLEIEVVTSPPGGAYDLPLKR